MKKTIALILFLLMSASLAACGNGMIAEENNNTQNTSQTEAATSETEPSDTNAETVETDAPADTEKEIPSFDASWASNEFEAMIPELPFKGWTVGKETDTIYELELGGLRTANGADTVTGFEEDKDTLITYILSLSAYGFTVEETGENYKWLVTNAEGNTIEFMCADGFCWITFNKAN